VDGTAPRVPGRSFASLGIGYDGLAKMGYSHEPLVLGGACQPSVRTTAPVATFSCTNPVKPWPPGPEGPGAWLAQTIEHSYSERRKLRMSCFWEFDRALNEVMTALASELAEECA
jgi:hypothetical protein